MYTLPRFAKSDRARFDFRVPDGLGRFILPDWDDPDLKVEFRDSLGEVRAVATANAAPLLVAADDHDPDHNPEGGPYVYVADIDLSDFAPGTAEAWVYARVDNLEVMPYPTILAAFEVVTGGISGPLYSTIARVKEEAPGFWPEELTDEMVERAVADASRQIDAALAVFYDVPFPDINASPATDAVIETICRKLAAFQCMEWTGRVNAAVEVELKARPLERLARLAPPNGATPVERLFGYHGPAAAYAGSLYRSDQSDQDALVG